MPIHILYKDYDGSIFNFSKKDYELGIKCAETHKFEIIIETKVGQYIKYDLKCLFCKILTYKFNNDKIIMYRDSPLNLTCSESIIKDIIE